MFDNTKNSWVCSIFNSTPLCYLQKVSQGIEEKNLLTSTHSNLREAIKIPDLLGSFPKHPLPPFGNFGLMLHFLAMSMQLGFTVKIRS